MHPWETGDTKFHGSAATFHAVSQHFAQGRSWVCLDFPFSIWTILCQRQNPLLGIQPNSMKKVFEESELEFFEQASFDRNPLHRDDSYARKSQFGQKVVYGMYAALFSLGEWL